jgi:hypothetical protein
MVEPALEKLRRQHGKLDGKGPAEPAAALLHGGLIHDAVESLKFQSMAAV